MKKKFFMNVLLSIVSVVVFFSFLEMIQRVRYPDMFYRYMYNSLGFRSPEFSVEKPTGTIRILFVGDSTTFGINNGLENTFPFLVEKILRERLPGKSIETINGARPARTSSWVLERIRQTLYLKPNIIIVLSVFNDVVLMDAPKSSYTLVDGKIMFKLPCYRKIHNFLIRHSVFYVTFREKMALLLYGNPQFAYEPFKERHRELDMEYAKICLANYRANLTKMAEIASANKIKLIFLKAPIGELRRRNNQSYYKCYQMVMEELEDLTRESGTPLLDLGSFFTNLAQREIFTDDIHFTDKANKRIAQGICEYLLKQKEHYLNLQP